MAQDTRRRNSTNRRTQSYYIDGNTARELKKAKTKKPGTGKKGTVTEFRTPEQRNNPPQKRYKKRESVLDLRFTVFVTTALAIFVVSVFAYLGSYQDYKNARDNVTRLESQLAYIESTNDSLRAVLNQPVDTQEVYRIATQELGMVYADESKYIYYDCNNSDYVHQYGEIPEK